eukprot:NODE_9888_length_621_cov_20.423695_g9620_i0.p1 GENE.NODE_9888_length_621_cov_20.423695_g9620_i0~~NODE_9888_length_621_cov_20.423695_g9620_i0.p1  ORF type:complete len:181 (-),score=10.88 NODE_9888_length_621_cov_20.423695_g9620_i0:79-573(-)
MVYAFVIHSLDDKHIEWFSACYGTEEDRVKKKHQIQSIVKLVCADFHVRQNCGDRTDEGYTPAIPPQCIQISAVVWRHYRGCAYSLALHQTDNVPLALHALINLVALLADFVRPTSFSLPTEFLQRYEEVSVVADTVIPSGQLFVADTHMLKLRVKDALNSLQK